MELKDYSGQFNPDLKYEDLSKDFLIKLIREYQTSYMRLNRLWYERIMAFTGQEKAMMEETVAVFTKLAHLTNPRIAKIANIEVKDVVDVMKVWQMTLDGLMGGTWVPKFEIKNRNHVIMTVIRCGDLEHFQRWAPERIKSCCSPGGVEELTMIPYINCFLPNAQVKMLMAPPGCGLPSKEGICCQWEYTLKSK